MRDILREIDEKLNEIEKREGVKILHAVESGSRAWGFASPDSDYDVRFVYVRPKEDYLRLDVPRDVIEWQLDEVLDINGWDLNKTLIQFRKGNATLFEWANSPVVYRTTKEWQHIYEQAKAYFSQKVSMYHYYGTANNTYHQFLQGEQVKYKKYFYALRPLLAAQYIEKYQSPPPVLFDELMKMDMPEILRNGIKELLEKKKTTEEKDLNPILPVIHNFIRDELIRQKEILDGMNDDRKREWNILNQLFTEILNLSIPVKTL